MVFCLETFGGVVSATFHLYSLKLPADTVPSPSSRLQIPDPILRSLLRAALSRGSGRVLSYLNTICERRRNLYKGHRGGVQLFAVFRPAGAVRCGPLTHHRFAAVRQPDHDDRLRTACVLERAGAAQHRPVGRDGGDSGACVFRYPGQAGPGRGWRYQ